MPDQDITFEQVAAHMRKTRDVMTEAMHAYDDACALYVDFLLRGETLRGKHDVRHFDVSDVRADAESTPDAPATPSEPAAAGEHAAQAFRDAHVVKR